MTASTGVDSIFDQGPAQGEESQEEALSLESGDGSEGEGITLDLPEAASRIERPDGSPILQKQPASNVDKRIRDLQSRVDKAEHKANVLLPYSPYIQAILSDPELKGQLDKKLSGHTSEPELVAPKAPERPASYNVTDASSNPDSESYKFREAQERFRDAKADYLEAKLQKAEQRERDRIERDRQELVARDRISAIRKEVQTRHGLTPAEASEFIAEMSQPDMTLDQLVGVFKNKRQGRSLPQRQRVQRDLPPISTVGGVNAGGPGLGEDDLFNLGLLEFSNVGKK